MGVADRCLVSERAVMYWNQRSFKGYQRRKSLIWAGHTCLVLHWGGHWRCYLLVIHLLLFREVHVHYVWGISVMNRWTWYEFSNAKLRGSIFVHEEWCFCNFAQDREVRQDARSTKMGEHLDRWWHASPTCSRNVLIKIPTLLNSIQLITVLCKPVLCLMC